MYLSLFQQTEMMYRKDPKFLNQIQYCEREGIPLVVIVGNEEKEKGGVKIRNVKTQKEVRSISEWYFGIFIS